MALRIYNAAADEMGGINWHAVVDLFAPMYGVEDIEDLIERLIVIKLHAPMKDGMA